MQSIHVYLQILQNYNYVENKDCAILLVSLATEQVAQIEGFAWWTEDLKDQ